MPINAGRWYYTDSTSKGYTAWMRFCMVTTFCPPYHFGGDAIFVQNLSRALVRQGHEVEVVHCEDAYRMQDRRQPEAVGDDGVLVHRVRSRLGPVSPLVTQQTGRPGLKARRLKEVFARGFDVVNFHNISLIGGPGILAASRAPINLYSLHEHWLLCPTHNFWKNRRQVCDRPQCLRCCLRSGIPPQLWRYTGFVRRCLAGVDVLLAPSRYTAERHRQDGITRPIEVLPLFTPSRESSPPPVERGQQPCFLYLGRVTASKGVAPLVEEFARLPDYRLRVVGEGDLLESLRQRYAGLSNIEFLGEMTHNRVAEELERATALVFPSLAPESFGLSVIEAFACGVPALVRAAGATAEIVNTTGGGIVYETSEQLRQALEELAEDDELRGTLSLRARQGFERFYSESAYLQRYLEIIADFGDKNRTQAGER